MRYRYHRQDYITYYSDVENTCWGIRVTENLSAQKQTGRTYGVLIALGLSALIIGVFCTQYFMTKKIFAPITHILQVFAQIRKVRIIPCAFTFRKNMRQVNWLRVSTSC